MRLLLVTTRSPLASTERDGGTIFASQVIRYLGPGIDLDVLFLRPLDPALVTVSGVKNASFLPPDMSEANRFKRRLVTSLRLREWLRSRHAGYDVILAQHVSSAFGLADDVAAKTVLFPMFTGVAYLRSGEDVPTEYIDAEREALLSAKQIICASRAEVQDVVDGYGVNANKVQFVPFGVNLQGFVYFPRKLPAGEVDLLYVGTIKPQKNQLDAVAVVDRLRGLGVAARLNLAGVIADREYHARLQDEVAARDLRAQVIYHGVLTPEELVRLAARCALSISVSRWETFGIAVFESLAMGLPVVAYDDVACFWEYLPERGGCYAVPRAVDAMAGGIAKVLSNPADYERMCVMAPREVARLDERNVLALVMRKLEEAAQ